MGPKKVQAIRARQRETLTAVIVRSHSRKGIAFPTYQRTQNNCTAALGWRLTEQRWETHFCQQRPLHFQCKLTFCISCGSASLLLHAVVVHVTQLIPEEQAEDSVRPNPEVGGPYSLIDPQDPLCPDNFGKAIKQTFIHQALQERGKANKKLIHFQEHYNMLQI